MDRAYETNPSANPPAAPNPPTLGYPSEANPATVPGAWWFHMITEEVRAAIVAADIAPDATKTNQLAAAISAIAISATVTTGTFNARIGGYAVTVKYRIISGCVVVLTIPPISTNQITGIGTINLTGIPVALMPASPKSVSASARWVDTNAVVTAAVSAVINQAQSAQTISFYRTDGPWSECKGPEDGLSLTYSLD